MDSSWDDNFLNLTRTSLDLRLIPFFSAYVSELFGCLSTSSFLVNAPIDLVRAPIDRFWHSPFKMFKVEVFNFKGVGYVFKYQMQTQPQCIRF